MFTLVQFNLRFRQDLWSQPEMSCFLQYNVRDPRSQDPVFLELCPQVSPVGLSVMKLSSYNSSNIPTYLSMLLHWLPLLKKSDVNGDHP